MKKRKKILPFLFSGLFLVSLFVLLTSILNINSLEIEGKYGSRLFLGDGSFDPTQKTGIFLNQEITALSAPLPEPKYSSVLGEVSPEEKWIEVDLSDQKLIAWEGDKKFLESLISSGKWGKTPVGEFRIWSKFRYTKMSGGSKELGTYYYLPNVPYTMYFYKGFGLHGTYWHNNFGQPMSHGCVNLPTLVAEKLFYWTTPTVPLGSNSVVANSSNPGTRVVIHD